MKLFVAIENHFESVGLTASQATQNNRLNVKNVTVCSVLALNMSLTGAYIAYTAQEFEEYVDSFYGLSTVFLFFVVFIYLILGMDKLFAFTIKLKNTINARLRKPASKAIYDKLDEKLYLGFKFLNIVMVQITPVCVTIPMGIASFMAYRFSDLGNDAFALPFPIWLPFDWQNPIGFSIVIALLYVFIFNAAFTAIGIIVFALGVSLLLISFASDIRNELHTLNGSAVGIKKKSLRSVVFWKQFIQVVEAHSNAVEMTNQFSNLADFICALMFGWGACAICGTMLMLQMELLEQNRDLVFILVLLSEMFWSVLGIFAACELGDQLSQAFSRIDQTISQLDWYRFPVELWRLLPILIVSSQQPVEIHAIGKVSCGRSTFKQIVNSGYTYFMTLRQFEN